MIGSNVVMPIQAIKAKMAWALAAPLQALIAPGRPSLRVVRKHIRLTGPIGEAMAIPAKKVLISVGKIATGMGCHQYYALFCKKYR